MRYVSDCCSARLSRVSSICPACEHDCIPVSDDLEDDFDDEENLPFEEDIDEPVGIQEVYDAD